MKMIIALIKLIIIILLLIMPTFAHAEKIRLEWDAPGDENAKPDGYFIFQRVAGEEYDYNNPVKTDEYPDGKIPSDVFFIELDVPGVDLAATKYEWVARTIVEDDTSPNSNQVDYTVVKIPPLVPIDLSGSFERDSSIIRIAWTQPEDDYMTHHWRVYYKVGEEEFTELGLVKKDQPLEFTSEFNVVQAGERKDVSFVVVAYRRSGVFSGNSQEIVIDVDRRTAEPVNLRINIEIPVI